VREITSMCDLRHAIAASGGKALRRRFRVSDLKMCGMGACAGSCSTCVLLLFGHLLVLIRLMKDFIHPAYFRGHD
jgi:hypothetical protein